MTTPRIDVTTQYVRCAGVETEWVDDAVVLFARSTGMVRALNPVASAVWESLVTPMSIDALVEALGASAAADDSAEAHAAISAFVAELVAAELVIEATP